MSKMKLTNQQVQQFLKEHYKTDVNEITTLSGGEWSQSFAYKHAGRTLVIRFGRHEEDYLKDKLACKFASAKLPIPNVLEVGQTHGGYYAISEHADGTMIDNLNHEDMKQTIPSLLATMDGIREADISHTTGYGEVDVNGNGKYDSWYDYLMAVNNDTPDRRTYGWKAGLANSPVGFKPFEIGFEALQELARDLPKVRSLIHDDLLHFNVLVNNHQITAVIDWANAIYGDFLYEISMFTFWGELHEPVKGIDWEAEAKSHYKSIGLDIPEFERRLRVCMLSKGLDSMAYYGYTKDWTYLESVAKRTLALAKGQLR